MRELMNNKGKINFTTTLLLIGFVPLICTSIFICILTNNKITNKLQKDIYNQLYVAADGLRQYYQYDIERGGIDALEYEHDYVDMLTDKDIQMTLFIGDERFITSAKNEQGNRNEGTKMDSTIWSKVKNGETYYGSGVKIGGKNYFVCYVPLYDANKQVVGSAWAGIPDSDVNASTKSMLTFMIVTSIISVIVFGVIILLVALRIVNIFKGMSKDIALLASGSLVSDGDNHSAIVEVDKVINDTKSLREKLYDIITNINSSADELSEKSDDMNRAVESANSTITNLNSAVEEIANGATSMANDVQDATESVVSVTNSMSTINENVSAVDGLSSTMMNNSTEVSDNVATLIDGTTKSIEDLKEISEKMGLVEDAVEKVVEAASEINGIASQTNLLSLNASIEAARAGDAGKGFAVVAGEISNLAEQSDTAAKTIRDIMNNLKNQTDEAVESIDKLADVMSKQGEISEKSKRSIDVLIQSINETNESITSIKDKTTSVSAECESLNGVIQNLSALSEENAASAEQTAASIEVVCGNVTEIKSSSSDVKDNSNKLSGLMTTFSF